MKTPIAVAYMYLGYPSPFDNVWPLHAVPQALYSLDTLQPKNGNGNVNHNA